MNMMEIAMEKKFAVEHKIEVETKKVAVLGSGLVGRCWAIVFARAGHSVNLFDVMPKVAQEALPFIETVAQELHSVGLLRQCKSPSDLLKRIHLVSDLKEALTGVYWAQECVPENLEHKKKIFQEMDNLADPKVILASSTSAIPASSFTSSLTHRNRCIVAHPVNPPHIIPLVELVPSPFTDEWVVKAARAFMEEVGQSPIVVKKEIDSFILNRLQGAVLNEAFKLVEGGYISPEDLDRTMKDGLGLRWSFMGPFETIDMNAPGGVKDYVERYSANMFMLAQQQAKPQKWEGQVVDDVVSARRELLPLDQLTARSRWRDRRLMQLVAHKNQQQRSEQQSK